MRLELDLPDVEPTTDDWYTPPWIFEGMGVTFDLDVAAPPGGVPWIPARRYYTETDNALLQVWSGLVWMNPPYSDIAPWCKKWAAHGSGIALLRADLSTRGVHAAFVAATSIYVPLPRIQFINGFGGVTSSVNFSTIIFGVGSQADDALCRLGETTTGSWRSICG